MGKIGVFLSIVTYDELVRSLKNDVSVIPTKVGIQSFPIFTKPLDSRFHGNDDFLRDHHILNMFYFG